MTDRRHVSPHRSRCANQFVDRLAFHTDGEQQFRNLIRIRLSNKHLIDQMTGLLCGEIVSGLDVSDGGGKINHVINHEKRRTVVLSNREISQQEELRF